MGCEIDICKLFKTGKNGLDFYIACRISELLGEGYNAGLVIISNDKGYSAVCDYWKHNTRHPVNITLSKDIAHGIVNSSEISERANVIRTSKQMTGIKREFCKYQENKRVREEILELFKGTDYMAFYDEIIDIVQGNNSNKTRYINSIKRFGREDGLAIYRLIRSA